MPNHVMNQLRLSGNQKRINELLESVKSKDSVLDFSKIIPMPEVLDVESGSVESDAIKAYLKAACPITDDYGVKKLEPEAYRSIIGKLDSKFYVRYTDQKIMETDLKAPNASELIKQGQIYVDNLLNYGATTWYDWRCNNWGTKWNATNTYIIDDNEIEFSTAWSCPVNIFKELSRQFNGVEIVVEFADEDIGSNCGKITFLNGEIEEYIDMDGDTDFALEVCGYDKEEYYAMINEE